MRISDWSSYVCSSYLRSVHLQPDGLRELAVAVGEHRHLAFSLVGLAPRAHDEGVVDRGARDLVDALGPERVGLVQIARQVLGRAGRREGAGHRKQRDLAALEEILRADLFGAGLGGLDEIGVRQAIANADGHVGYFLLMVGRMRHAVQGSLGRPVRFSSVVARAATRSGRSNGVEHIPYRPDPSRHPRKSGTADPTF